MKLAPPEPDTDPHTPVRKRFIAIFASLAALIAVVYALRLIVDLF